MDEKPKNLWKNLDGNKYQEYVTTSIIDSTIESENVDERLTYGNNNIDEFIKHSQLNAVFYEKYLEWIPFEKFQNITYIAEGGFGKIYTAEWLEGYIYYWDIENQKWHRYKFLDKYVLK
ncbi:hypothetical protein C1646_705498, partial [Rhizophagus diaphanus]